MERARIGGLLSYCFTARKNTVRFVVGNGPTGVAFVSIVTVMTGVQETGGSRPEALNSVTALPGAELTIA